MKRTPIVATAAILLALATGFWFYRQAEASVGSTYRMAAVERGDLATTVTATGALRAVTTVQVGTQVSGQVSNLYADFNDEVSEGQLIARIDPTLQQQAVREAQAELERARANLEQAGREYDRNQQLHERKVITETEFNTIQYNRSIAQANMTSAEVGLERARRNLSYTAIYAPIDGIVVERNVDVGQTVAASLSAPQLFLIANDLSRMQILASVDESDIGLIHEGQPVRFTVQPYPNERFTGTVEQVRLQSTTVENVVNYTVAVEVQNPDGKLLPGMTATVDFVVGSTSDALIVPNAALRFEPPGQGGQGPRARPAMAPRTGADSVARTALETRGTLWYTNGAGELVGLPVTTGISDGIRTVVRGAGLEAGMEVIVGIAPSGEENADGPASPFQAQQQGGRRGGF